MRRFNKLTRIRLNKILKGNFEGVNFNSDRDGNTYIYKIKNKKTRQFYIGVSGNILFRLKTHIYGWLGEAMGDYKDWSITCLYSEFTPEGFRGAGKFRTLEHQTIVRYKYNNIFLCLNYPLRMG